ATGHLKRKNPTLRISMHIWKNRIKIYKYRAGSTTVLPALCLLFYVKPCFITTCLPKCPVLYRRISVPSRASDRGFHQSFYPTILPFVPSPSESFSQVSRSCNFSFRRV